MKRFFFLSVLLIGLTMFTACDKDDDDDDTDPPVYSVMVMQPNTDNKMVGDSMHIHVEFTEASDMTVHHAQIRIYNAADNSEVVYTGPTEAHVHEEDGAYSYHDDFVLNVTGNTNWILEAKVWGHEAGLAEAMQTVEFHVDPM